MFRAFALALGATLVTLATPTDSATRGASSVVTRHAPDTTRRSVDWLGLLPDGEEKRRFILDCTGCHQLDDQIARPGGRPRTQARSRARNVRRRRGSRREGEPARAGDRCAGDWWVVLGARQMVARYSPRTRSWRTWPGGFYPHSVALAGDGGVWINGHFTHSPELIARIDTTGRDSSRALVRVEVPSHPALGASPGGPIPYEIRVAPDGRVWTSELQGNRVFAYDPRKKTFDVFTMPEPWSGPRRFDIDGRGILWVPAYATNELVRLDPKTRRFTRFPLPEADAVPYVVRVDDVTHRIWVGTAAADAIYAYDEAANHFTVYPLPSRGALVRHLAIDPRTRDLWIAYGASPGRIPAKIARLQLR